MVAANLHMLLLLPQTNENKNGVFLHQIEYTVGASEQLLTCNSVLVSIFQAWVAMPDPAWQDCKTFFLSQRFVCFKGKFLTKGLFFVSILYGM